MAAFPTHLWTLVLIMRDFSWLSERTNVWDAFGVGAYGLLIALAESIFVFGFALASSLLLPPQWEEEKRLALLFTMIVVVALWSISDQLCFMMGILFPKPLVQLLAATAHPVRMLYSLYFILASLTVAVPIYLVARSKRMRESLQNAIERLSLLSALYLSLDIMAIVVVTARNLRGLL